MLSVSIHNLGKKYGKEWIFRDLSHTIAAGQKLAVMGGNGSGKSTLLQIISGFVVPNAGTITYTYKDKPVSGDNLKDHIAFASPYLQLVEEFTLEEMISHAAIFKPFGRQLSVKEIIDLIELDHARHKLIRQFSSGMKQRLKLGLAILADTPLLLLDEPVSNLDRAAIDWYKQLIHQSTKDRTVIVCSNAISDEHSFCDTQLNVMDFKRK